MKVDGTPLTGGLHLAAGRNRAGGFPQSRAAESGGMHRPESAQLQDVFRQVGSRRRAGIERVRIVRRCLLAFLAIAAIGRARRAPDARRRRARARPRRVREARRDDRSRESVPDGLGPGRLFVGHGTDRRARHPRPARRMDRRRLRSRSAMSLPDGPGGLLGMALDPGLLKGTGNDHVYVAYTYDADADPATVSRSDEDRALHLRSARARARQRQGHPHRPARRHGSSGRAA